MEKLIAAGVNLRKSIGMGMVAEMYPEGTEYGERVVRPRVVVRRPARDVTVPRRPDDEDGSGY